MNGRTKGLAKGTPDRQGAATWRALHGCAVCGWWLRGAAAAGVLFGRRGHSSRTNDGRAHRTLHTQTHHKHALRLQRWQSTWRFLPGCVVDYGFLLRREVLGGHVRISRSLRRLQCDNSYQGSALCSSVSSNEVIRQGRTKSGVPAGNGSKVNYSASYSEESLWHLAPFCFLLSFLQGIKQAWIRSIHTMRSSAWTAERPDPASCLAERCGKRGMLACM